MSQTVYLETRSTDPRMNLAFEEYVLTHRREGDLLLLWQNANTVVIGQNQNAEAEINRSFVEAHGIRVVRRITGGGAVYHDLGNLNYSFITDAQDAARVSVSAFTAPVVRALRALGLNAEASGRNDILVDGKKVSGTAQRLSGSRILHHGTLLFDSDPAMVAGALNVDPEKFRSKGSKSVRSRIGNIRSSLPQDMTLEEFWDYLKRALSADGSFRQEELRDDELAAVLALKESKYDTWAWTFGRSPKFDLTNRRRFSGGSLEVGLRVEKGIIADCAFYGDFLSLLSPAPLAEALRGVPFREADTAAVLDRFPLAEMFGGITRGEILETLFHAGDRTEG